MIIALTIGVAYLILLTIVLWGRIRRGELKLWLSIFCGYSALLMALHALFIGGQIPPPPLLTAQFVVLLSFALSIGLLGLLTLAYLEADRRVMIGTGAFVLVWMAGIVAAHLTDAPPLIGAQLRVLGRPDTTIALDAEIAAGGWLAFTLALFALVWRAFLRESLPLYANRILFWAFVLPLALFGDVLAAIWLFPLNYAGYALRAVGAVGLVYGAIAHRVVDLRGTLRWIISRAVLTIVAALLVFGGIAAALYFRLSDLTRPDALAIGGLVALVVAVLMLPVMRFMRWLLRNLTDRDLASAPEVLRRYGQRINNAIELDDLAAVAVKTINELLMTRRSHLILATRVDDYIALEKVGTAQGDLAARGTLSLDSPIYQHFVLTRRPLLQYDIDYHRDFFNVPEHERRYFAGLEMDIYAPIVDDDQLIGLLAVGPKANDDPFHTGEMDLLEALATQTVAALKNARLVSDLRALNQRISALNEDLRTTNERLQLLDSVKTDFIAIASHELRTPLTQIQGYADLLREMGERNLLDPQEMLTITTSLGQATQRMAEVISSMLDVSQIDVDSMDLDFVEVTLSSVLKLAVEPYADAIHERKQTLTARGLRNLPPIYGDYKRLVQAFQNLITNAIKFTPDGGRIDIEGQVCERDEQGEPISVQIAVRDTGIGIDKEHHDLIFEKFFRVGPTELHSSGKTKFKGAGPGLGLPIARGIIEAHGGRIWVESEGHNEDTLPGSTFYVVLPVRPPAMEARKRLQEIQEAKQQTVIRPAPVQDSSTGEAPASS